MGFIVNGNITVAPPVGTDCNPTCGVTPALEGVYIAKGTFATGASTDPTAERFVGEGVFVAGNFSLQRDLDSVGQNTTTASELFFYNPQLLLTMPDAMKDVPVTWQEVAP